MQRTLTKSLSRQSRLQMSSALPRSFMLSAAALPFALAQTAAQIVPESFRPSVAPFPGGFPIPSMLQLEGPTAVENRSTRAGSYGVGLRWGAAPKAGRTSIGASFEAGRQERSDNVRTEDSFIFSLQLRF